MTKIDQRHTMIAAGIGGSGVVWVGTLVARAGLRKYKYVSRFPNFSAYMRGGPCECTVILADSPIFSPVVAKADALLILNNLQLPFYEDRVHPDGVMIVEGTGLEAKPRRKDIKVIEIPAIQIATSMSSPLVSNMILLGVYVGVTGILPQELIEDEIKTRFTIAESGAKIIGQGSLMAQNIDAFKYGMELAKMVI